MMRKKVFALLLTVSMTVTLCGCGYASASSDADTTQEMESSENISEEAEKETPNEADTTAKEDESPTIDTPAQEEKISFSLQYDDADVEIFFDDCICEYDKNNRQVYTYFVDSSNSETSAYAVYILTPEDSMEIFPVKDYRVDKKAGAIYMLWGDETFERIQGVDFVHDLNGFKIESTYSMESLIGEVYGLELLDTGEDFDNLQVEFTELYEDKDKTLLRGTASAIYRDSEKTYAVEWVIDTEGYLISANKITYLSDLDIHPLYASFLRNEISVASPYTANIELSVLDDRKYTSEFDNPEKGFYLLDLTGDGFPELLFEIRNRWGSDRLLYILGIRDDELICYDLFETHTSHVGFAVYDNGVVESGYRFQNGEADSVYYRYNTDGSTYELIHFFRNIDPGADLDLSHIYDYYYLDGNQNILYELHSDEEYESVLAPYLGEFPEWLDCKDFADIPY